MIATGVSRNPGFAGLLLADVFDMMQNPSNLDCSDLNRVLGVRQWFNGLRFYKTPVGFYRCGYYTFPEYFKNSKNTHKIITDY